MKVYYRYLHTCPATCLLDVCFQVSAVGGGIWLLEKVRAALQQTIALLITQTQEQLQESEGILYST